MSASPPEFVRQQNRAIVLTMIQEQGPISRVELATLLGLNPATITRIARDLVDEGLIREEGEGESKGAGRKRVMLHFNHGARLVIGLHITRKQATAVIADLASNLLTRRTALVSASLTLPFLEGLIDELLDENPHYRQGLAAICLSSPVDDAALIAYLKQLFDVPVFAAEAVAMAALGEAEAGTMREQDTFALFYLGAQSYSCLYVKGHSLVGALGLGRDGQALASQINDAGLVEAFKTLRDQGVQSALAHTNPVTARLIFEAARHGDPGALQAVEHIAGEVAFAIGWLARALDLAHVVLAGWWLQAADVLLPLIQERVRQVSNVAPAVSAARLGDDAPLIGAVRLAIKTVDVTA